MITEVSADEIKRCCADLYASDWLRMLLGDSLHPGGLALTERAGHLLGLNAKSRVLDVGTGAGASAILLASHFGCRVVGLDFSDRNLRTGEARAQSAGVVGRVRFVRGDAERLPFATGAFDAAICECVYSTFPDKRAAARELRRIVAPGGRLAFSDVTRSCPLPPELQGPVAALACLADAGSAEEYVADLGASDFRVDYSERQDALLAELIRRVRARLVGAQLLGRLGQFPEIGIDLTTARAMARSAADAVDRQDFGYVLIVATAVGSQVSDGSELQGVRGVREANRQDIR